jgi:hypothetical protein
MIPDIAKPFPVSLPPDFSILIRLMIPQMIEGIAVKAQVKMLRIPRTRDAMARPLVFGMIGSGGAGGTGDKTAPQALQD